MRYKPLAVISLLGPARTFSTKPGLTAKMPRALTLKKIDGKPGEVYYP
jgi:hypothetical protein